MRICTQWDAYIFNVYFLSFDKHIYLYNSNSIMTWIIQHHYHPRNFRHDPSSYSPPPTLPEAINVFSPHISSACSVISYKLNYTIYIWPLNDMGVRCVDPLCSLKSRYNFWLLQNLTTNSRLEALPIT